MNFYQLYHSDSYLREMEAVVVCVEGNRIALDQTVFYAQSGRQPADHGRLSWTGAQTRVVDVCLQGETLWHQVEGPITPEGTRVQCLLDWIRQRAHTALHLEGHESKGGISERLRLVIEG
jgi:Ser-tRNA(Ala) deacylase AlaX